MNSGGFIDVKVRDGGGTYSASALVGRRVRASATHSAKHAVEALANRLTGVPNRIVWVLDLDGATSIWRIHYPDGAAIRAKSIRRDQ